MRVSESLFFGCLALCFSNAAYSGKYDHCVEFAKVQGKNTLSDYSNYEIDRYNYYKYCKKIDSEWSQEFASGASVSLFDVADISGSGSVEEIKRYVSQECKTIVGRTDVSVRLNRKVSKVADSVGDTFSQCIALTNKNVQVVSSIVGPDFDVVTLSVKSTVSGDTTIFHPEGKNFECTSMVAGRPGTRQRDKEAYVLDNKIINFHCRRSPAIEVSLKDADGYTYKERKRDSGYIALSGSALDVSYTISVPDSTSNSYFTPVGTILPFAHLQCPKGWDIYSAAYGRVLRMIDPTGKVDTQLGRQIGSPQADQLQTHRHDLVGVGSSDHGSGNRGNGGYAAGPMGYRVAQTQGAVSEPGQKEVAVGGETRVKNIAVNYCIKTKR